MRYSIETETVLKFTDKYIGKRNNIGSNLETVKKNPEIVEETILGINSAIRSLNEFLELPNPITNLQQKLLPNACLIKGKLNAGEFLPTISELVFDSERETVYAGIETFRQADRLMERGENQQKEDAWEFQQTIQDPEELSDALGIELYGKYTANYYPWLSEFGFQVTLALEEMLAVYHQDTRLFKSIAKWYSEEEGFSPLLVKMVRSD